MNDYIEKIKSLEQAIQENKTEATKIEERLRILKEEKANILSDLKKENMSLDDLEETIENLETNIQKQIEEIENELR